MEEEEEAEAQEEDGRRMVLEGLVGKGILVVVAVLVEGVATTTHRISVESPALDVISLAIMHRIVRIIGSDDNIKKIATIAASSTVERYVTLICMLREINFIYSALY